MAIFARLTKKWVDNAGDSGIDGALPRFFVSGWVDTPWVSWVTGYAPVLCMEICVFYRCWRECWRGCWGCSRYFVIW